MRTGTSAWEKTEFLVAGDARAAVDVWNEGLRQTGERVALLLRIAEAQTSVHQFSSLEQTLTRLDALLAKSGDYERDPAKASAALFRGKMLLARNQPLNAIAHLKTAALLGLRSPETAETRVDNATTAYSALISLGTTYGKLGRHRDAADSFDRAFEIAARCGVGLAGPVPLPGPNWEIWTIPFGKWKRPCDRRNKNVEAKRLLAQLLLQKEVARPAAERDWRAFEEALQTVRHQLADSWKLRFLEIDYALQRQERPRRSLEHSEVLGKLYAIERDFPKEIQVWQMLPFAYELLDQRTHSDRALNRLEWLTKSSTPTKLLTVDLLLWRGDSQRARQVLEQIPTANLSDEEKLEIAKTSIRVLESEGDQAAIDRDLLSLRSSDPENAFPVEKLLDRRMCGASTTRVPYVQELIDDFEATTARVPSHLALLRSSLGVDSAGAGIKTKSRTT